MFPSAKQIRKFWFYVEQRGPQQCWPWIGAKSKKGYGTVTMRIPGETKEQYYAHRVAYSLVNGPIPAGHLISHSCDNPSCVNPAHLILGTNQQNLQEARDRGLFPQFHAQGPYVGRTKEELLEICNSQIPRRLLRDKYGLTMDQISYIRKKGIQFVATLIFG